jgi:hypothetical protein
MLIDSAQGSQLGKSFDSGFRARHEAISPASGVRSAQGGELLQAAPPPPLPLGGPRRRAPPPEPEPSAGREELESEFEILETEPPIRRSAIPLASELFEPEAGSAPSVTRVSAPDQSLLALARRDEAEREESTDSRPIRRFSAKRFFWFVFGIAVGTGLAWGIAWVAASDVSAEVYSARVWMASKLRAIRPHPGIETPAASSALPDALPVIPTVDVTQLPRAREEREEQAPSQGQNVAPASAPPAPGAPALQHAPGPR